MRIISILFTLTLFGCGPSFSTATITSDMLDKCVEFCNKNEGVASLSAQDQYISYGKTSHLDAYRAVCSCKNKGQLVIVEKIK